jgi:PAS domain S-box-containing protein
MADRISCRLVLKVNLLTKGLLLVSIPLCFEITLFGVLLDLQNQVEREAERIAQGKRTNDAINTILQELIDVGHQVKNYHRLTEIRRQMRSKIANIHKQFDELKLLLKDDPEKLAAVLGSEQGIYAVERHLAEMNKRLLQANFGDVQQILAQERRRMNSDFETVLSTGFLKLAQERREEFSDDKTLAIRKQIRDLLKIALGLSVVLGLSGAFFLSKNLSGRLALLENNANRLANGEALLPRMKGDDEIAHLDKTFHLASNLISAASRKEKAILQNTKDVIMSINEGLAIESVNPAVASVLERSAEDLIGKRFSSLLDEKEAEKAAQYFQDVQAGNPVGSLDLQVPLPSGKHLTMSLSGNYSALEKTYYFVLHDVTAAKEVDSIRREVTAMITHDLKTPLQTIGAYLQMLRLGRIGDLSDKGQNLLSVADRSCDRMAQLIESVLNLEKIRSGAADINLSAFPLGAFLTECAASVKILADTKEIEIVVKVPDESLALHADRHWMQQVVVNLTVNAVHYSPEKSTVTLDACTADGHVEILVSDEGPGIPESERALIFERFHRLEGTAKKVAGSGLGLSFCKEMVGLHHGYIRVEDNKPRGTTFIVGLPRQPDIVT